MGVNNKGKNEGFTLIEVIFAIIILASSLTVLLGLQSAAVSKGLRDRNQLQAMLLAKNILAAIEIKPEVDETNTTETVARLLEDFNAVPSLDDTEKESYNGMYAKLVIEEWQNPDILTDKVNENVLKRVYLKIFWGDFPEDQMEIVYFIPNKVQ